MTPLEARINGEWHKVVGKAEKMRLPVRHRHERPIELPGFYVLDNGLGVPFSGPNVEYRGKADKDIFICNRDGSPKEVK